MLFAGVSWRPAALFARGSALQLFDERRRTALQQQSAADGGGVETAVLARWITLYTLVSGVA